MQSVVAGSAIAAMVVGVVCSASCGGHHGAAFVQQQDNGSVDGSVGDDGGCSGFATCTGSDDGGGNFGGSSGGSSSGIHPTPTGSWTQNDCPGQLGAATATSLQSQSPDPSMKWLYPYDSTMFPGGIGAPVLQWAQTASSVDGLYLHLHSQLVDYKGCFKPMGLQLPLPANVWLKVWAQSNGVNDPLTVELTTIAGGKVSGPISQKWLFALGSLKAQLYYNSYDSQLTSNTNNGAVMSIAPGAAQPTALLSIAGLSPIGPCISCHAVSSNGSMLVAQKHFYLAIPGGLSSPGSMSFDLAAGLPDANAPVASTMKDDWGFSAVYPDGSRLLTSGESAMTGGLFPAATGNNPGMIGPNPSQMYNPTTGATIPFSGLAGQYAMMPMFSQDGKKVVFNGFDYMGGNGHTLVVMDFDPATNTFSNPKQVYSDANKYPGWPFFTPDAASVIFALGDSSNFASLRAPPIQASPSDVAASNLFIVDIATGMSHQLSAASPASGSYLPYGSRDENLDFYPTVSPVASGGYFWVYFTSRRNYGNTIVGDVFNTQSKKIWVSAISIGTNPGTDASHPAFYLPAQEQASGNIRAFASLAPCKSDGMGCELGIDCCGGSCYKNACTKPPTCSALFDRCTVSSDCCDKTLQCIGGVCSTPPPR
jgi:hypothetical protein